LGNPNSIVRIYHLPLSCFPARIPTSSPTWKMGFPVPIISLYTCYMLWSQPDCVLQLQFFVVARPPHLTDVIITFFLQWNHTKAFFACVMPEVGNVLNYNCNVDRHMGASPSSIGPHFPEIPYSGVRCSGSPYIGPNCGYNV
jgi:hypothetical protein